MAKMVVVLASDNSNCWWHFYWMLFARWFLAALPANSPGDDSEIWLDALQDFRTKLLLFRTMQIVHSTIGQCPDASKVSNRNKMIIWSSVERPADAVGLCRQQLPRLVKIIILIIYYVRIPSLSHWSSMVRQREHLVSFASTFLIQHFDSTFWFNILIRQWQQDKQKRKIWKSWSAKGEH